MSINCEDCYCCQNDDYEIGYLLSKASKKRHNKCIKILHGNMPIFEASLGGHIDCIKLLVEYGGNIYHCNHVDNCTPLIRASYNGHLECVKYLCEQSDSQRNLHHHVH